MKHERRLRGVSSHHFEADVVAMSDLNNWIKAMVALGLPAVIQIDKYGIATFGPVEEQER